MQISKRYIVPKSTNESRAQYSQQPAWGYQFYNLHSTRTENIQLTVLQKLCCCYLPFSDYISMDQIQRPLSWFSRGVKKHQKIRVIYYQMVTFRSNHQISSYDTYLIVIFMAILKHILHITTHFIVQNQAVHTYNTCDEPF